MGPAPPVSPGAKMAATTEPRRSEHDEPVAARTSGDESIGEAVFLRSVLMTARELDDCLTVLLGNTTLARNALEAGLDPLAYLDEIQRIAEVAAGACARLRGCVAPAAPAPRKVRSGRILVAEDEPLVAELARRILSNAGYQVDVVPHGLAAIDCLRRGGVYDALLSDVAMPYLDGLELARLVASELPTLPMVLMSGYCDDERRSSSETLRRLTFLAKPFRSTDLVAAIDGAIRERVAMS